MKNDLLITRTLEPPHFLIQYQTKRGRLWMDENLKSWMGGPYNATELEKKCIADEARADGLKIYDATVVHSTPRATAD